MAFDRKDTNTIVTLHSSGGKGWRVERWWTYGRWMDHLGTSGETEEMSHHHTETTLSNNCCFKNGENLKKEAGDAEIVQSKQTRASPTCPFLLWGSLQLCERVCERVCESKMCDREKKKTCESISTKLMKIFFISELLGTSH